MKETTKRVIFGISVNEFVCGSLSVVMAAISPAAFFISKNYTAYSWDSIIWLLLNLTIIGFVIGALCFVSSYLLSIVFYLICNTPNPFSRAFALVSAMSAPSIVYLILKNFDLSAESGIPQSIVLLLIIGLLFGILMLLVLLLLNWIINGSAVTRLPFPRMCEWRQLIAIISFSCLLSLGLYVKDRVVGENLLQNPEGRAQDNSVWNLSLAQPGEENPTATVVKMEDGSIRAERGKGNPAQFIAFRQSLEDFEKYAGKKLTVSARICGQMEKWVQVFIGDGTEKGYVFAGNASVGEYFVVEATFTVSPSPKELFVMVNSNDSEWVGFDWVKLEEGDRATPFIPSNSPLALEPWMPVVVGLLIIMLIFSMGSVSSLPIHFTLLPCVTATCLASPLFIALLKEGLGLSAIASLSFAPILTLGVVIACAILLAWWAMDEVSGKNHETNTLGKIIYALTLSVAISFTFMFLSEFAWKDSVNISMIYFLSLFFAFGIFCIIRRYGCKPIAIALLSFLLISAVNIVLSENKDNRIAGSLSPPAAMPTSYVLREKPNIYFILAESMHSRKGLLDICDWNYPSFDNDLVEHAFTLYEDNTSGNYWSTLNSLLSIFSMRHHYYKYVFGNFDLTRSMRNELANNSVFKILKNNGYSINLFASITSIFKDYSRYFDYENNKMEKSTISKTSDLLSDISVSFLELQRTIFNYFGMWESMEKPQLRNTLNDFKMGYPKRFNLEHPNFTFIYKGAGHVNFSNPDPGSANGLSYFNQLDQYKRDYQRAHNEIMGIVQAIIAADPSGLIVIVGDHGALLHGGEVLFTKNAEESNVIFAEAAIKPEDVAKSALDILLAIRWPEKMPIPKFPANGLSSVNLFPFIFSAINGVKYQPESFEDNLAFFQDAEHLKVVARNGKWLEKWEDMEIHDNVF